MEKQAIKHSAGRMFTAEVRKGKDGFFVARCIELNITTQGKTYEETLANIRKATEGYLEALQKKK